MKLRSKPFLVSAVALSVLTALPGFAQDPAPSAPPSSGGWRRFEGPTQATAQPNTAQPNEAPPPPAQAGDPQGPPPRQAPYSITVPAGTWLTIRVNEPLSSDHSQTGDAFTATLAEPVVADGLVLARRGQTVMGMVSEAQKAGRVQGTSKLGLELTALSLVDGRQVQLKTALMDRKGNTSYGRDAAAIGTTTATGAAIGAAVNGGVGAGVGAAAGVVASTIGVLLTRGKSTVVYPETALTFQLQAPLTINNVNEAFRPSTQQDYDSRVMHTAPRPGYGPPAPYYGGYGYYGPYYGYPNYWGPSLYFGYGYYGGFHRGGFRRW